MSEQLTGFNDAAHVKLSRQGDHQAFAALVNRHLGMVHAIALSRLQHDSDQADELTQEVFLRAWLQLDKLSRPEYFPAWLAQITRNLAGDWIRRDRRKSALVQLVSMDNPETASIPSEKPTPQESQMQNEDARGIYAALQKLPADQRELLLLHYCENLTQSDIARRLHVHPSTIMRKLDQALKRLRTLYLEEPATALRARAQNHDPLKHRMATILAATCALSAPQRKTLAASTAKSNFVTDFKLSISRLFEIIGDKFIAAAVLFIVLVLGILFYKSHHLPEFLSTSNQNNLYDGSKSNIAKIQEVRENAPAHFPQSFTKHLSTTKGNSQTTNSRQNVNAVSKPTTALPIIAEQNATSDADAAIKNAEQIPRSGLVNGRIVDSHNHPLAGITLNWAALTQQINTQNDNSMKSDAHFRFSQPRSSRGNSTTDFMGRFAINSENTGTLAILASHSSYAGLIQKVDMPTKNIQLTLPEKGATVQGSVMTLAGHTPVPNAEVTLLPEIFADIWTGDSGGTRTVPIMPTQLHTKTDNNGKYTLDHLPVGRLHIMASSELGPSLPTSVYVNEDVFLADGKVVTLPDLYIFPGYQIHGTVRDKLTSKPLSNVTISQNFGNAGTARNVQKPIVTDTNGQYTIHALPLEYGTLINIKIGKTLPIVQPISASSPGYERKLGVPDISPGFDLAHLDLLLNFDLIPLGPVDPS